MTRRTVVLWVRRSYTSTCVSDEHHALEEQTVAREEDVPVPQDVLECRVAVGRDHVEGRGLAGKVSA